MDNLERENNKMSYSNEVMNIKELAIYLRLWSKFCKKTYKR